MIIYQTILKENEQPTWAGSSSTKLPPAHPPSLASAHLAGNPLLSPPLFLTWLIPLYLQLCRTRTGLLSNATPTLLCALLSQRTYNYT